MLNCSTRAATSSYPKTSPREAAWVHKRGSPMMRPFGSNYKNSFKNVTVWKTRSASLPMQQSHGYSVSPFGRHTWASRACCRACGPTGALTVLPGPPSAPASTAATARPGPRGCGCSAAAARRTGRCFTATSPLSTTRNVS